MVDETTVRHIARLARIRIEDDTVAPMAGELSAIINFVEQLSEVDTQGVTPKASGTDMTAKLRADEITQGGEQERVTKNAPESAMGFYAVPKVVE
ncbi:MAG: Asp-tRNA(Asn)/Glu-tRNA(Gln) amidotransferase subunit GatC [Alphaproteobacteria bacterium]